LEPIDNWKGLLKPLRLQDKLTYNMSVYYLTNDTYSTEISRLNAAIKTKYIYDNNVQEVPIDDYKKVLVNNVQEQRRETKEVFNLGKAYSTFLLIAINIFLFILLECKGGSMVVANLINMGAKYYPAMIGGEWWREFTSMFLHIGFLHLFINMLALYFLGFLLELIYGT